MSYSSTSSISLYVRESGSLIAVVIALVALGLSAQIEKFPFGMAFILPSTRKADAGLNRTVASLICWIRSATNRQAFLSRRDPHTHSVASGAVS